MFTVAQIGLEKVRGVLPGYITSPYGWRNRGNGLEFHHGMDIGVSQTQNVPIRSGNLLAIVTRKGFDEYGGNSVSWMFWPSELELTARHMAEPASVNVGEVLAPGTIVGIVGRTGDATENHLHLEIRYRNQELDPEKVVETGPIPSLNWISTRKFNFGQLYERWALA